MIFCPAVHNKQSQQEQWRDFRREARLSEAQFDQKGKAKPFKQKLGMRL